MADLDDDKEQEKQAATTNTLLAHVTSDTEKTGEEVASNVEAITEAQDALDDEKKQSEVIKKINEKNALFDPTNYITPVAPSADKLSNEDYYPGLNQNVIQGYHQGKFFNSALVGASSVAPMAVVAARRKEIAQQAYTKAKNEEIAKAKVLSFKVTAAPQFISELQDQAMLYTKEMAAKYANNYQALLKDPEYIATMQKFDTEGKKTLYVHERILKTQKDAQKSNLTINPENNILFGEYANATGDFDAKTVAEKIRKGEFSATTFADKIKTNDNLEAWSKTGNLDRFVVNMGSDEFKKAPKGTYDKLVRLTKENTYIDKNAYLKGLAEYTRQYDLYNSGNPDAPTDSPEFKKWEKFSENQWQSDIKYKMDQSTKQDLYDAGLSEQFQNHLAWLKHQDEKYNYYGEVEKKVTDEKRVVSFAQNTDAKKRRADYAEYMKQFPTNKNNGFTTIQLGEPTNNKGTWSLNQAGITMKGGDGKFYTLTPQQIIDKANNKETGAKFKKQYKGVYEDAKKAIENKAGKSVIYSEEVGHFVRSSEGKWIPLELAGDKKHTDVTTMIIQKSKIVTGYQKVEDPNKPGVYTQEPIVSNTTFTVMKPIGEEYEKANLLNHKATSSQVGAAKVY